MTSGKGPNGRCNQDGCVGNLGKLETSRNLYGPRPSATIDSSKPFHVRASFTSHHLGNSSKESLWRGATMTVQLSQDGGPEHTLFDSKRNGNPIEGQPEQALV
mmetsp:Transcript_17379/g.41629  ORF Transcript_17379/g.41629 Transcript_17379/m.41629 type:complete len:103 (-) Transcript_17379:1371-1679(-)